MLEFYHRFVDLVVDLADDCYWNYFCLYFADFYFDFRFVVDRDEAVVVDLPDWCFCYYYCCYFVLADFAVDHCFDLVFTDLKNLSSDFADGVNCLKYALMSAVLIRLFICLIAIFYMYFLFFYYFKIINLDHHISDDPNN